jgi:hypothetical protein
MQGNEKREEKAECYISAYKYPRKGKLVYLQIWATSREEAIRKSPAEIIHNNRVYPMYGFIGLANK